MHPAILSIFRSRPFDRRWAFVTLALLAGLAGCGGGGGGGAGSGSGLIPTASAGTPPTESNGNSNGGNISFGPSNPSAPTIDSPADSGGSGNESPSTPSPTPTNPPVPTPLPVATAPFSCASDAITCIEVASTSTKAQASVPITFGQPFKAGDWKHKETGLLARDNFNTSVPLQFDEVSSHRDGSARFAVLSAQVSNLQAGERRIVNLYKGVSGNLSPTLPANPDWNMELVAKVYSQQTTRVNFGNRSGQTAGTPFQAGESITLRLVGPATENYTITVSPEQAGGGHETLTKIAQAFMQAINGGSSIYIADKLGPGGGYERLWIKTRNPNGGAFQVQFSYSGQASITQVNESNYQAPQVWIARAQEPLKQAIASANLNQPDTKRRLHGVAASEFGLSVPFKNEATGAEHPHLVARLDTRLHEAGARIRTDVVLENNWTFKADPRNITYELTIRQSGEVVHQQPAFTHYHHARWHKVVWKGAGPGAQIRHHMPYFMASRAVWNYDRSLAVSESTLAAEASNLAKKRTEQMALGPMGNVFLQPHFPGTGGRPEIGPFPRWTALYLVTQDQRAYDSMMANADAAAAVPVHYRDESTDQPVNAISHPTLSVYETRVTVPTTTDPTIWSPDTAHQGSFTYVPYLVTGDRFYLDEAMFWATWNVFMNPSDYRGLDKALINRQQIRGQAWALRSIGEAYRILPDNHTMKSYYTTLLENNLNWYAQYYLNGSERNPTGAIQHSATTLPPWQNDFVGIVFALLAENDDPHARQLHTWFSRFSVGRFMADNDGFCAAKAPGYSWTNAHSANNYMTQWSELFARNYAADVGKACNTLSVTEGYPHMATGYAAYARGMLGAAANAGIANAPSAYAKWRQMTPLMDKSFLGDPTWAIVPR